MAITVTFRGVSFLVPETDEEDWGDQGTAQLVALLGGLDDTLKESAAGDILNQDTVGADLTISTGATLTWTHNIHGIQSDGGAITVGAVTGISAGEFDQQKLLLMGLSDTDTVQIDAAGNVDPNGAFVSQLGWWIEFRWDLTNSVWRERGRSH